MGNQSLYAKFFTEPEIQDIINVLKESIKDSKSGVPNVFPEDICEIYKDRGVMPWHLQSMFSDHGASEFFKIKHYGNVQIKWHPHNRNLLWQYYYIQKKDDWEIAKLMKTSWQNIKKARSRYHLKENDPRWVQFIHNTKKGFSSTQERLKHSTSDFQSNKEVVQKDTSSVQEIKKEKVFLFNEDWESRYNSLNELYDTVKSINVELQREIEAYKSKVELNGSNGVLKIVHVTSHPELALKSMENERQQLIANELISISTSTLIEMIQDRYRHYKIIVDKYEMYLRLINFDVTNGIGEFQIVFIMQQEF